MITSIDGINIKPNLVGPYDNSNPSISTSSDFTLNASTDWAHIDQTSGDPLKCVQGQIVLANTTACFRCSPKSCFLFNEIMKITNTKGSEKCDKVTSTDGRRPSGVN